MFLILSDSRRQKNETKRKNKFFFLKEPNKNNSLVKITSINLQFFPLQIH